MYLRGHRSLKNTKFNWHLRPLFSGKKGQDMSRHEQTTCWDTTRSTQLYSRSLAFRSIPAHPTLLIFGDLTQGSWGLSSFLHRQSPWALDHYWREEMFGLFVRFAFLISSSVHFPCHLQHFGAGSCHFNGICSIFELETLIFLGGLQHFGARTVHGTW